MREAGQALPLTARRIDTRSEAEILCAEIGGMLDRLVALVHEETRLVRASKLVAATGLQETKAELARHYALALETLRNNAATVGRHAPVLVDQLRRRHEAFQSELQVNMAVLATARSVSETLVRGVAEEVASRNVPKTYGSAGVMTGLSRSAARPVAVSRSL
jgi:hypothetical protein